MHRPSIRWLLVALLTVLAVSVVAAAGTSAAAVTPAKKKPKVTCKQLTKAEIQPLDATSITDVKVTPVLNTGQQCVFSGSDNGQAIDVLVATGSTATAGYKQEVASYDGKVAVPGVGDKAFREKGDFQIVALKGDEYCSVSTGSGDTIPGVGALEAAAGGSSDIPESDNAVIAEALGTICNRLYGSGNTKPSLAGLSSPDTSTSAP